MRRELRAPKGAETLTYSFHFQISNKGGRQACTVEVQAPNVQERHHIFPSQLATDRVHSARPSGLWNWRPPSTQASGTRRAKYARCEARKTGRPKAAKKVGQ